MKAKHLYLWRKGITCMILFLSASFSNAQWQKLDGPEGGNVSQIVSKDGLMFARVEQDGGIYQSTNNGLTWTDISPDLNNIFSYGQLHVADTALFAAFLGDNGGELYVSYDNATTWQLTNYSAQITFGNSVFSMETHNTTLLAGSNGEGIFKSTDGGINWTPASTGLPSFSNVNDIYSDGTILLAAVNSGNRGVYRSDDSGDNWYEVNTGIPAFTLVNEITKSGTQYIIGTQGQGILISTDALSWTQVLGAGPVINQDFINAFYNEGQLLAGTVNGGLFESLDNGTTWSHITASDLDEGRINTIINHGGEIYLGNENGIRSSGDGINWTIRQAGLLATTVNSLIDQAGTYYAGTFNGVNISNDMGSNWSSIFDGIYKYVQFLHFHNGDLFAGTDLNLYRSDDLGLTWSIANPIPGYPADEVISSGSRLIAGAYPWGMYYSDDNGTTWTASSGQIPAGPYVEDFFIYNGDIYVGLGNGSENDAMGGVYRSSDNGDTWNVVSDGLSRTFPGVGTFYHRAYNFLETPNAFLAFTSRGVYEFDDINDEWIEINSTFRWDVEASYAIGDSVILAGTFSQGLQVSYDDGATWQEEFDGPAYVREVIPVGTDIHIGTISQGIQMRPASDFIPPTPCIGNFAIPDSDVNCSSSSILIPIEATSTVSSDVVGFDFCMTYDENLLIPTGNASIGDVVHGGNSAIADYFLNTSTPGEINGLIYFNGAAPFPSYFSGIGTVISIEFQYNGSVPPGTMMPFTLCGVNESTLFSGDIAHCNEDLNHFTVINDPTYLGTIEFWGKGARPLQYDELNPGSFLPTSITGTDISCTASGASTFYTDLNGQFVYEVAEGDYIRISRDIPGAYGSAANCTDVMSWINGADQNRAMKIATMDPSLTPNVYQMIAADVNRDNKVTAADITLMSARSVMSICGFSANGIDPIEDWVFVDQATLVNDPTFSISTSYPADDGAGYSRNAVPSIPNCLSAPINVVASCAATSNEDYSAILLGDVNGNWQSSDGANARLASSQGKDGKLIFELSSSADEPGTQFLNAFYESENAVESVDFSFDLPANLQEADISISTSDDDFNFVWNIYDGRLLLSGYWIDNALMEGQLLEIKLSTSEPIVSDQLNKINAFVNGTKANTEVSSDKSILNLTSDPAFAIRVYPNPANSYVILELSGQSMRNNSLTIYNTVGKIVRTQLLVEGHNNIDLSMMQKGVYLLKVNGIQYATNLRLVKTE